jgi:hypothetical protein
MATGGDRLQDAVVAQVVGEDPHPRALLYQVHPSRVAGIAALFPVSAVLEKPSSAVMEEWDLVVSESEIPDWLAPHLNAITFGNGPFVGPDGEYERTVYGPPALGRWLRSPARALLIPDDLPAPIAKLVRETLAPTAHSAARNEGGNTVIVEGRDAMNHGGIAITAIRPFLQTREGGFAIAGSWTRKSGSEVWSLPFAANRPDWIKAAIEVWSEKDAVRFPRARWKDSAKWATPSEAALRSRRDGIEALRRSTIESLDAQLAENASQMEKAIQEADAGLRALLLDQSDPLVSAVERVLRDFGFIVKNVDSEVPETDRREDLRLSLPGSDWCALVEIKGYKGGAAVTDLLKVQRFALRYAKEFGKPPEACWYVVNQFLGRDPDQRPAILQSNPTELASFAEGGGLVADTTEIFKLARDVENGVLTQESARRALLDCRGRFTAP